MKQKTLKILSYPINSTYPIDIENDDKKFNQEVVDTIGEMRERHWHLIDQNVVAAGKYHEVIMVFLWFELDI